MEGADGVRGAHILFCTYHYPPGFVGGAERQAQLQAEELVRRGFHVTVVCPGEDGTTSGVLNGVRVHRLPRRKPGRGWQAWHVATLSGYLLRRLREFDLVHVHLAGAHLDAVVALASLAGRPVYVKLAAGGPGGDIAKYPRWPLLPRWWGLRRADRVQALSEEITSEARAIGIRPPRLVEIPNGLDLTRFRRPSAVERAAARRRLELPSDEVLVLYAGRLHEEKGTHDLLAVWESPALRPLAWLVLVGDSPWGGDHEGLNARPQVIARPFTDDIADYYRAADVFVLPSYTEGMSNALLEAMASGLPSVATRVGAAESVLCEGENGLLVHPGDRSGLSRALRALAEDPKSRGRMGASAAAAVRRFSISAVVDRLEREYGALLGSHASEPDRVARKDDAGSG